MLKARDVARALKRMGFVPVRQKGAHLFFEHTDGRTTLVPKHGGEDISRGLLYQILREIEIEAEKFLDHL